LQNPSTAKKAAISRFLEDGWVEIDNNAAENALRTVELGGKYLFCGTNTGGINHHYPASGRVMVRIL